MPQANSTTSSPRWMSPLESAKVLPCSDESSRARSSYSAWISSRNLNSTRARRCGLVAAQPGKAACALAIAFSTSALLASATLACTSPVFGLNTSPVRPDVPATCFAADEMADVTHGVLPFVGGCCSGPVGPVGSGV